MNPKFQSKIFKTNILPTYHEIPVIRQQYLEESILQKKNDSLPTQNHHNKFFTFEKQNNSPIIHLSSVKNYQKQQKLVDRNIIDKKPYIPRQNPKVPVRRIQQIQNNQQAFGMTLPRISFSSKDKKVRASQELKTKVEEKKTQKCSKLPWLISVILFLALIALVVLFFFCKIHKNNSIQQGTLNTILGDAELTPKKNQLNQKINQPKNISKEIISQNISLSSIQAFNKIDHSNYGVILLRKNPQ